MEQNKQIVVIADDFTGAAEISGIGLRHGLKVRIETGVVEDSELDMLVIATDTRSMAPTEAAEYIKKLAGKIMELNPVMVYKKIDSVLRGNVTVELAAQMKVMGLKRTIIIAGNPLFKRIVKEGKYFINNIPLDKTSFSNDPQHPVRSNDVIEILDHPADIRVVSRKPGQDLPPDGLVIGDVETMEDLDLWAGKSDGNTLFAGASGFFNSLLMNNRYTGRRNGIQAEPFSGKTLFILGSSFLKDDDQLKKMIRNDHVHSNMPEVIYYSIECPEKEFSEWVNEIAGYLENNRKVIVSSFHNNVKDKGIFLRIKKIMAELVRRVMDEVKIDELLIEGGSTASEILNSLEVKNLCPVQELEFGVIRMKVSDRPGLFLTTKPGSYKWPESVWEKKEILKLNQKPRENISLYG